MNNDGGTRPIALVTGASGYLGGRLVARLLSSGWAVHAVVRPTSIPTDATAACLSRIVYDGTSTSLSWPLEKVAPHVIFHLAAEFQRGAANLDSLVRANVLFPTHLAEAASAAGCRVFINTATFWQHLAGEAYDPVDLYAATKQAAEDMLFYFHRTGELTCITLMLFDTYGPNDPRRKLLGLLLRSAVTGSALDLSPGEQLLDLTHVDDVAAAFQAAAETALHADRPVWERGYVSAERMTVRQLVTMVASATNGLPNVRLGARPYKDREVMTPIIPAPSQALAHWTPRRTLARELPALVAEAKDEFVCAN